MQLVGHILRQRQRQRQQRHQQRQSRRGDRGQPEDRHDRRRDGADHAGGFTLYSFAPDTPTTSNCNGTCAQNWPPVTGPTTASGVTGTFGTIKRSDGSTQATFDGHPLYAFVGDTAPGQNKGNGLNGRRRAMTRITTSGTAPAGSSSWGSGGGGY